MIDLHAHVLPGVDDGPKDIQQTEANLQQAISSGIKTLVAVAHSNDNHFNVSVEQYTQAFTLTQRLIEEQNLPITILPAIEVRLGRNLADGYRSGAFLPVADSGYICIELPPIDFPSYTLDALYHLALENVRPFLIHPERNRGLRKMPELVDKLMSMGIVGVASMGSITGQFGEEVQQSSWTFIEKGLIQAVVTDGHSTTKRPLTLSTAYQLLQNRYGEETAIDMTYTVPRALLQGTPTALEEHLPIKRRGFLKRLFAGAK